jgi:hypothetical protein
LKNQASTSTRCVDGSEAIEENIGALLLKRENNRQKAKG